MVPLRVPCEGPLALLWWRLAGCGAGRVWRPRVPAVVVDAPTGLTLVRTRATTPYTPLPQPGVRHDEGPTSASDAATA